MPEHYSLVFEPDFGRAGFDGEAAIDVQVHESTDEVVLNAADLEISAAHLVSEQGTTSPRRCHTAPRRSRSVFQPEQPLEPGKWRLHLRFSGKLNDQLRGFYRSKFRAGGRRRGLDRGHPVRGDRRPAGFPVLG